MRDRRRLPYRKGDLRSVTNALGQTVETLAYDAFGRPLSVKDANGIVTDYTYHARGWPTSVTVRGCRHSRGPGDPDQLLADRPGATDHRARRQQRFLCLRCGAALD